MFGNHAHFTSRRNHRLTYPTLPSTNLPNLPSTTLPYLLLTNPTLPLLPYPTLPLLPYPTSPLLTYPTSPLLTYPTLSSCTNQCEMFGSHMPFTSGRYDGPAATLGRLVGYRYYCDPALTVIATIVHRGALVVLYDLS